MEIILPADRPRVEVETEAGLVVLSPIIKSDRRFLEEGLDLLSTKSRFARFGQGIAHLSRRELDYLSDVDQVTHVAWGAALEREVAGVGRYVRGDDDDCPEVALTVLDEFQGRGIGPTLFSALVAVARHDGISALCFEALQENEPVRRILSTFEITPLSRDGRIDRQIRLADLPESPYEPDLVEAIVEVRASR